MTSRLAITIVSLALAGGCVAAPTEALVNIDVVESLRADLSALRIIVEIPPETDGGPIIPVHDVPIFSPPLPYVLALVPRDGDSRRTWRIEAQAVGSTPGDVTVRTLSGSYREDAVTRFDLLIEACPGMCPAGEYCLDLACTTGPPR